MTRRERDPLEVASIVGDVLDPFKIIFDPDAASTSIPTLENTCISMYPILMIWIIFDPDAASPSSPTLENICISIRHGNNLKMR
ncbi:hypothetical protein EJ110_NYTH38129 [Nymphaea thermarum]|nr:hypothetical protein EJ110_NYTH38129 [Nymphaea thermarum]